MEHTPRTCCFGNVFQHYSLSASNWCLAIPAQDQQTISATEFCSCNIIFLTCSEDPPQWPGGETYCLPAKSSWSGKLCPAWQHWSSSCTHRWSNTSYSQSNPLRFLQRCQVLQQKNSTELSNICHIIIYTHSSAGFIKDIKCFINVVTSLKNFGVSVIQSVTNVHFRLLECVKCNMTALGRTIFQYSLSAASIYFLPPNQEAGGVSKVDVSQLCVVVDGSRVDQVFDRHHVLVTGLDVHVQASDHSRTPLTVEQEDIVFGLYKARKDSALFLLLLSINWCNSSVLILALNPLTGHIVLICLPEPGPFIYPNGASNQCQWLYSPPSITALLRSCL